MAPVFLNCPVFLHTYLQTPAGRRPAGGCRSVHLCNTTGTGIVCFLALAGVCISARCVTYRPAGGVRYSRVSPAHLMSFTTPAPVAISLHTTIPTTSHITPLVPVRSSRPVQAGTSLSFPLILDLQVCVVLCLTTRLCRLRDKHLGLLQKLAS